MTKHPSNHTSGHQRQAAAGAKNSTPKAPVKSSVKKSGVQFQKEERDAKHVSSFSMKMLDDIRKEAGLSDLWISRTISSPAKQSEIMYAKEGQRLNIEKAKERVLMDVMLDPNDSPAEMRYRATQYETDLLAYRLLGAMPSNYATKEGMSIQSTAREGIKNREDPNITKEKMTAQIQAAYKKGVAVSNHLGRREIEVVDISLKGMSAAQQAKLVSAVRQRLGSGVLRFGHENPKKSDRREFNDKDCFHIEIQKLTPVLIEELERKQTTA